MLVMTCQILLKPINSNINQNLQFTKNAINANSNYY